MSLQTPKHYYQYSQTFEAGEIRNISCGDSDYFGILSVDGGTFVHVSFDRSGGTQRFDEATGHRFDSIFTSVEIENRNAAKVTVVFVCAKGKFDDNRVTIAGKIDVNNTATIMRVYTFTNPSSIPSTGTGLGANPKTKRRIIRPLLSNIEHCYIIDSDTGHKFLIPDEGITLENNDTLIFYLPPISGTLEQGVSVIDNLEV